MLIEMILKIVISFSFYNFLEEYSISAQILII